jgi:hypothetical protein
MIPYITIYLPKIKDVAWDVTDKGGYFNSPFKN